jgi:hypothetical protein
MLGLEPLPFNRGGINILALTESPREIDEKDLYEKAFRLKNVSRKIRAYNYFLIRQFIILTGKESFFPTVEPGQKEVLVKDKQDNLRYTIYISDEKKKGYNHIYGGFPNRYVFIRVVDQKGKNVKFGQLVYYP